MFFQNPDGRGWKCPPNFQDIQQSREALGVRFPGTGQSPPIKCCGRCTYFLTGPETLCLFPEGHSVYVNATAFCPHFSPSSWHTVPEWEEWLVKQGIPPLEGRDLVAPDEVDHTTD